MKNFTLVFAIGLTLLTSCTKDESLEPIQQQQQQNEPVYVLNQNEVASAWDTMFVDEALNVANRTALINNEIDAHTDGYYVPTSRDAMTITWSGTESSNGARGSAEITQTTPNFSFHFVLETECVTVQGNQAVYGGTITQVRVLSGNAPNIGVGWRFYFKVIDSEHIDQIANTSIFASPRSISLCNVYLPNNPMWSSQGNAHVIAPGYVVVDQ